MRFSARVPLLLLSLIVAAIPASARVLSYAPYTNLPAMPAVQHRMNRHFVLLEISSSGYLGAMGEVVIHDSAGLEEPRVVYSTAGTSRYISHVAAREDGNVISMLLRYSEFGSNGAVTVRYVMSTDSGATWKAVDLPETWVLEGHGNSTIDWGGPFVRGRFSQILPGTASNPFVVGLRAQGIFAVGRDASIRRIIQTPAEIGSPLLGTDITGERILVHANRSAGAIVDMTGAILQRFGFDETMQGAVAGWVTPDNAAYLTTSAEQLYFAAGDRAVLIARGGGITTAPGVRGPDDLVAAPTSDYRGAWYTLRGAQQQTSLYRHTMLEGSQQQWSDITAPEVEALHAGASGQTVLIQVHRPRPEQQRVLVDPALAVWHVGQPAPRAYDELFMDEQPAKAFVHLDVDRMEAGEPFVFDSGVRVPPPILISSPPPSAGGGDIIQEWGVVRASLRQQLVLPGIGRTRGGFGSDWSSDVTLYNPLSTPQKVAIRYAENGTGSITTASLQQITLTLAPREIRVIEDALRTLFAIDSGNGALFLTPEASINASSRTFSRAATGGTYGFNMNAIDIFNAASPRFPVSFAGAFPGANFRTNLVVTDALSGGTDAALTAIGSVGFTGSTGVSVSAPNGGQSQANNIGVNLGVSASSGGGLLVRPSRGFAIASVYAIDNRTNDPTYFPPDLSASVIRTIPAVGHVDGANGAKFRSDLYLYNPASGPRTVFLQAMLWGSTEGVPPVSFTLLGNEARIIPDALFTLFGRSGIARLRYSSSSDSTAVRVTSRTYTVNADGATYGFLMPPLNEFQGAAAGEGLEILGTRHDARFRTNLGLVDLSAFNQNAAISVDIELVASGGAVVDSFRVNLPAGGLQLNDVFRSRNIADDQPLLIRVRPVNGTVGAFASMIDNTTNDPTYIAANLASRP